MSGVEMGVEQRDLRGTVVVVTGATSGIGRSAAEQLLAAGAKIAITGRRQERLEEIAKGHEDDVVYVAGDVADARVNDEIARLAIERWGRIDSLIAAAGIGMYGDLLESSEDELSRMIDTNYTGTVWSVRSVLPTMVDAGAGDIVVVSSVAGVSGGGNESVYAGTKAAQLVFAEALDKEVRPKGLRVTSICPAATATEFAIGAGRTEGDAWLDEVLRAEDVAAAIVFTLTQPRRFRTTRWDMWSQAEGR
ncbi:MAG: SDR family oxidoreductase [Leucobacter sp.]